jgi:serine protease inhibitor
MPLGDVHADSNGNLVLASSGSQYSDSLSACQDTILSSWDLNSVSWRPIGPGGYSSAKIYLPKFEVTSDQSLSRALAGLGLSPIFKPGDFDRLADVGDIFVSEVKQKVYIKVDEEGTEAAAVTSIVMMRAMIKPMNELFLKFDRPFHLSILHNDSGIALFTGTINNPVSNNK